jgi:hypothetical protein
LPKESKKKATKNRKGNEQPEPKKENSIPKPAVAVPKRDYFCTICFEAFGEKAKLEDHMKTHRELEVTISSCRMEEQPAGVF